MNSFFPFFSAILVSIFFLFSAAIASAHDAVFPGEKLKSILPAAESFEQRNLYLSEEQQARIEKDLGVTLNEEDKKPSVYFAVERDPDGKAHRSAVVLFIDAQGLGGKIETGIMISSKGELLKVAVFENTEQEAVLNPSFLSQFAAKKSADPFQVGKDITAPVGQEKSAQAIASGVRRGMLILQELFRKK